MTKCMVSNYDEIISASSQSHRYHRDFFLFCPSENLSASPERLTVAFRHRRAKTRLSCRAGNWNNWYFYNSEFWILTPVSYLLYSDSCLLASVIPKETLRRGTLQAPSFGRGNERPKRHPPRDDQPTGTTLGKVLLQFHHLRQPVWG
jgi:hypothetical protein